MVTIIRLESPNKCGNSFTSSSTKAISAHLRQYRCRFHPWQSRHLPFSMREHRLHHLPSCRRILASAARLQSIAFYLLAGNLHALLSFAAAKQWLRLRSRGRLSATLAARSILSTVQSFLHSLFARYPKAPDNRQTFHLQPYESRYSPSARQLVYQLVQLLEWKSAVLPIAFDFRQAQQHRKPVQKRLCPSTFENCSAF